MHTILTSLERIAYNHDPLKVMLVQTTYQPFISFFHMTGIAEEYPEVQGIGAAISSYSYTHTHTRFCIADYSSAIAIELRRGNYPEYLDFIRIKFKNGTTPYAPFRDLHIFGHEELDVPLTEFIYRTEVSRPFSIF